MSVSELESKSEAELTRLIQNANQELQSRINGKRKDVIRQIRALADSIQVTVELIESSGKGSIASNSKVAAKYRNPANAAQTWTGRGVAPKWMQALLEAGRDKAEFAI